MGERKFTINNNDNTNINNNNNNNNNQFEKSVIKLSLFKFIIIWGKKTKEKPANFATR